MALLVVATAFAAVTLAFGYRGSLQIINEIAPDDRRAELVSSYYILCFVGNAVPVIGLGMLTSLTRPLTAAIVFAATIAVLGIGAWLWRRRMDRPIGRALRRPSHPPCRPSTAEHDRRARPLSTTAEHDRRAQPLSTTAEHDGRARFAASGPLARRRRATYRDGRVSERPGRPEGPFGRSAVTGTVTEVVDHPLAMLTGDEIAAAVELARRTGDLDEGARFAYVGLSEPDKDVVRAFGPGDRADRRVRMVIVPGPSASVVEAVVSLTEGVVCTWEEVPGARPALLIEESMHAIAALKADPDWQAAMRRRGIDDFELVQIDPWPAGNFGLAHEENRRISRCLSYVRHHAEDNGYARPVEGVIGFVDMGRRVVLEVLDTGTVPLPPEPGSYLPEDNGPLRSDLKPLEISQPEGPSYTVEGNLVRWQRWSLRVSMDPLEGLVLHTVAYEDGGRLRPVLHRASVSEMVVPYGDPGPMHGWKSAFDVGEWGLGRMANSLALGCDCLGEVHYFDADYADERGRPHTLVNGICLHEEDYGILWKHADLHAARTEVRRSRRLVVSSIATVGNYEYGFYWYFYLDGTIQLEVKLTGVMSTMGVSAGESPRFATLVAPQLAAPYHQHLFNVRLDVEVDGPANSVYEVETHAVPAGPDNPWGNAFEPVTSLLATEQAAQRVVDPSHSRYWKVVNPAVTNRLGQPVAFKLVPGPTPTLLADAGSSVGRRARFATRNLWVTRFAADERRAAGDHPNQHVGDDGLPRWTAADRPLVETDVVVWYTFGVTHIPRPEDWPVMPVEYTGFTFMPSGFFDHNPALDVPPGGSGGHR